MTNAHPQLPVPSAHHLVRAFEYAHDQSLAVLDWAEKRRINRTAVKIALLVVASVVTIGSVALVVTVLDVVLDTVLRAFGYQLHEWSELSVVRVFTDGVDSFLAAHSTGLELSSSGLTRLWFAAGGVFLLCAIARSLPARLAWSAYGLATVVMAWFGSDSQNRPVTAGAAALAWGLLSLAAFTRRKRRPARPAWDARDARDAANAPIAS